MDTQKDADIISGPMTCALIGYSGIFMRYAFAVTPKNYLLFGCHIVNFSAQITQGYRYLNYWQFGGREKSLEASKATGGKIVEEVQDGAKRVEGAAKSSLESAKKGVK